MKGAVIALFIFFVPINHSCKQPLKHTLSQLWFRCTIAAAIVRITTTIIVS